MAHEGSPLLSLGGALKMQVFVLVLISGIELGAFVLTYKNIVSTLRGLFE